MKGLLLTLVVGLFILLETVITFLFKKKNFVNFTFSLALGIIVPLLMGRT